MAAILGTHLQGVGVERLRRVPLRQMQSVATRLAIESVDLHLQARLSGSQQEQIWSNAADTVEVSDLDGAFGEAEGGMLLPSEVKGIGGVAESSFALLSQLVEERYVHAPARLLRKLVAGCYGGAHSAERHTAQARTSYQYASLPEFMDFKLFGSTIDHSNGKSTIFQS